MGSIAEQVVHEKKLQGSKCEICGYVCFPATSVCPKCGPQNANHVKLTELPSKGAGNHMGETSCRTERFPLTFASLRA